MRQSYQDDFFNQRMAQCVYGMVDENAAVVEGNNLYSVWKPGLNLGDLLLDRTDHFAGVGAVTNDNDPPDRFLAILIQNAAPELGAKLHAADVADRDRRAVV